MALNMSAEWLVKDLQALILASSYDDEMGSSGVFTGVLLCLIVCCLVLGFGKLFWDEGPEKEDKMDQSAKKNKVKRKHLRQFRRLNRSRKYKKESYKDTSSEPRDTSVGSSSSRSSLSEGTSTSYISVLGKLSTENLDEGKSNSSRLSSGAEENSPTYELPTFTLPSNRLRSYRNRMRARKNKNSKEETTPLLRRHPDQVSKSSVTTQTDVEGELHNGAEEGFKIPRMNGQCGVNSGLDFEERESHRSFRKGFRVDFINPNWQQDENKTLSIYGVEFFTFSQAGHENIGLDEISFERKVLQRRSRRCFVIRKNSSQKSRSCGSLRKYRRNIRRQIRSQLRKIVEDCKNSPEGSEELPDFERQTSSSLQSIEFKIPTKTWEQVGAFGFSSKDNGGFRLDSGSDVNTLDPPEPQTEERFQQTNLPFLKRIQIGSLGGKVGGRSSSGERSLGTGRTYNLLRGLDEDKLSPSSLCEKRKISLIARSLIDQNLHLDQTLRPCCKELTVGGLDSTGPKPVDELWQSLEKQFPLQQSTPLKAARLRNFKFFFSEKAFGSHGDEDYEFYMRDLGGEERSLVSMLSPISDSDEFLSADLSASPSLHDSSCIPGSSEVIAQLASSKKIKTSIILSMYSALKAHNRDKYPNESESQIRDRALQQLEHLRQRKPLKKFGFAGPGDGMSLSESKELIPHGNQFPCLGQIEPGVKGSINSNCIVLNSKVKESLGQIDLQNLLSVMGGFKSIGGLSLQNIARTIERLRSADIYSGALNNFIEYSSESDFENSKGLANKADHIHFSQEGFEFETLENQVPLLASSNGHCGIQGFNSQSTDLDEFRNSTAMGLRYYDAKDVEFEEAFEFETLASSSEDENSSEKDESKENVKSVYEFANSDSENYFTNTESESEGGESEERENLASIPPENSINDEEFLSLRSEDDQPNTSFENEYESVESMGSEEDKEQNKSQGFPQFQFPMICSPLKELVDPSSGQRSQEFPSFRDALAWDSKDLPSSAHGPLDFSFFHQKYSENEMTIEMICSSLEEEQQQQIGELDNNSNSSPIPPYVKVDTSLLEDGGEIQLATISSQEKVADSQNPNLPKTGTNEFFLSRNVIFKLCSEPDYIYGSEIVCNSPRTSRSLCFQEPSIRYGDSWHSDNLKFLFENCEVERSVEASEDDSIFPSIAEVEISTDTDEEDERTTDTTSEDDRPDSCAHADEASDWNIGDSELIKRRTLSLMDFEERERSLDELYPERCGSASSDELASPLGSSENFFNAMPTDKSSLSAAKEGSDILVCDILPIDISSGIVGSTMDVHEVQGFLDLTKTPLVQTNEETPTPVLSNTPADICNPSARNSRENLDLLGDVLTKVLQHRDIIQGLEQKTGETAQTSTASKTKQKPTAKNGTQPFEIKNPMTTKIFRFSASNAKGFVPNFTASPGANLRKAKARAQNPNLPTDSQANKSASCSTTCPNNSTNKKGSSRISTLVHNQKKMVSLKKKVRSQSPLSNLRSALEKSPQKFKRSTSPDKTKGPFSPFKGGKVVDVASTSPSTQQTNASTSSSTIRKPKKPFLSDDSTRSRLASILGVPSSKATEEPPKKTVPARNPKITVKSKVKNSPKTKGPGI